MTLNELKNMSNEELIKLANKVDNQTKAFKTITDAEFSYNTFINELKRRNLKRVYMTSEKSVIDISKKTNKSYRQQFTVSDEVATRWKAFTAEVNAPYPSVLLDAALTRFMDQYYNDEIDFNRFI